MECKQTRFLLEVPLNSLPRFFQFRPGNYYIHTENDIRTEIDIRT